MSELPQYSDLPERAVKAIDGFIPSEAAIDVRVRHFADVAPRAPDRDGATEILDGVTFTHRFVRAPGDYETVLWHYVECGEGEPIVFLHGIPDSWYQWHHQMSALSTIHRCIAVDLKGYGQSEKSAGDYRHEGASEQLYAMLQQIGVTQFNVVTHDRGTVQADFIAANHPEAVLRYARGEQHLYHFNPSLAPQENIFRDSPWTGIMEDPKRFAVWVYTWITNLPVPDDEMAPRDPGIFVRGDRARGPALLQQFDLSSGMAHAAYPPAGGMAVPGAHYAGLRQQDAAARVLRAGARLHSQRCRRPGLLHAGWPFLDAGKPQRDDRRRSAAAEDVRRAMVADVGHPPTLDLDFWSDAVLGDPYPYYRQLRDLGPVVWLSRHEAWALTRHHSVRAALLDGATFTSARGCMMNEATNRAMQGVMLCSDDPAHRALRRVFARPLSPAALAPLRARLADLAEERVRSLAARGAFDAVTELAHYLPLTVVTDLVGLGEEGKAKMLAWAAAIFNAFGPETHARTVSGMEITGQAFAYLQGLSRETLDPGGWGAALFDARDRGEVSPASAQAMLMDYLAPSLDTTINAISSAVWLFARHPAEWDRLRATPALVQGAIDEVLRLESPIRAFARHLTHDHAIGEVILPEGSRALMLYACANRDERRYAVPDRFDISRDARDHLGFGYGPHMCAGLHLARMEVTVVLEALLRHVARFTVVREERVPHNTLRGLAHLDVAVDRIEH